ncbi:3'(2'),5'-bisphosphate nucleotidase [Dimargaris xerosporica]|nr:3'(2'),5'-bisphosphate nucleotidase [Dimargaris xerosporica]
MAVLVAERAVAIDAVLRACQVCQSVFKHLVSGETVVKADKSPVTVADLSAQAVVNSILGRAFPKDPIVGEEDSTDLQGDQGKPLRDKVLALTNQALAEPLSESQLLAAIDRGNYIGGSQGRHWTLDPIDGTQGFIRGDQFAVCLALIEEGQVVLGVMGCPNLLADLKDSNSARGSLFIAIKGHGAFQRSFDATKEQPIHVSQLTDPAMASFCESVMPSHSSHADAERIGQLLHITKTPLRMDSQCKYGCIARGDSDIYLRLPVRADYVEKIWDHATGSLLVHEAGGRVTDIDGKPLDFSIGRYLSGNRGVVAANSNIHSRVLQAVQQALSKQT